MTSIRKRPSNHNESFPFDKMLVLTLLTIEINLWITRKAQAHGISATTIEACHITITIILKWCIPWGNLSFLSSIYIYICCRYSLFFELSCFSVGVTKHHLRIVGVSSYVFKVVVVVITKRRQAFTIWYQFNACFGIVCEPHIGCLTLLRVLSASFAINNDETKYNSERHLPLRQQC